jgi:hypothetical protein
MVPASTILPRTELVRPWIPSLIFVYLVRSSTSHVIDRSLRSLRGEMETKKASSPFAILASMEIKENGVRSAKEDKP